MGKLVVVDLETDGNLLGTNSMVCFGADQVVHYITLWAILLKFTKIVV